MILIFFHRLYPSPLHPKILCRRKCIGNCVGWLTFVVYHSRINSLSWLFAQLSRGHGINPPIPLHLAHAFGKVICSFFGSLDIIIYIGAFGQFKKLNRTLMNFQQMSVSQYEYLQSFPPQYSLSWSISSLGSGGPMKIIGRKPAGPPNWLLSWPSWSGSLAAFIHIKLFFNRFLNKVIRVWKISKRPLWNWPITSNLTWSNAIDLWPTSCGPPWGHRQFYIFLWGVELYEIILANWKRAPNSKTILGVCGLVIPRGLFTNNGHFIWNHHFFVFFERLKLSWKIIELEIVFSLETFSRLCISGELRISCRQNLFKMKLGALFKNSP